MRRWDRCACCCPSLSARDTADDDGPAFVVQDHNYVSARWPGDAYLFARRFRDLLRDQDPRMVTAAEG